MPRSTKVCKICGKTYPYCRSMRTVEGVFRWQDVACCPEHGSEYLAAIMESRGETVAKAPAKTAKKSTQAKPVVLKPEAIEESISE